MGQGVQINKPRSLNLDRSKQYLREDEMFFALNNDCLNAGAIGRNTPLPANYLGCEIEMPEGDNYVVGSYYSNITNETYVMVGNTNNAHFVYRINGDGSCQIVNHSECLQSVFGTVEGGVFNPKHSFEQWRCYLRVEKICANRHGKEFIFTNGLGNIGCIDVDASIATNSFSTYFFTDCEVGCETVELCVPQPCGCIEAEFLPLDEDEVGLTNKLVDVGIKFMYQHVYYDLRASEWSSVSSLYFQSSKGCFANTEGFSRCLKLTLPLGNPLVDKINVAYSTDNGVNWLMADTVEKYESYSSTNQYWYERNIDPELERTGEDGCYFLYRFCNDKQCQAIDPADVSRVFNPIPRQVQGFIQIKSLLGFYNFVAGTCPIDQQEIKKFTVTPVCVDEVECTPEYVDVTVRTLVHNWFDNTNTPIFRHGGSNNIQEDDISDTAYFGSELYNGDALGHLNYYSHFTGKQRNFTAYIEGTDYFVEMKQYKAYPGFVNRSEIGIISGVGAMSQEERDAIYFGHDYYYFQEAIFKVKKGAKGFIRLKSHQEEGNSSNGSTYIRGVLDNIADYEHDSDLDGLPFTAYQTEIEFDTTGGDVDIREAFVVENALKDSDITNHSSVLFFGYLKLEDGTPIEKAELWSDDNQKWMETDHNGFFFRSFDDLDNIQPFSVRVELDCDGGFEEIKSVTLSGSYGGATQTDITLLDTETEDYRDVFVLPVEVPVVDCDNQPVAGISIALSGSKSRVTGADGIARFEVRNNSSRDRELTAIIMDESGCLLVDCEDECNPAMPSEVETAPACFEDAPPLVFDAMGINISQLLLSGKGLKKGGRYGFAILAKGDCGRISAPYPIGFINIPKLQENGIRNYCTFDYNANDIVLPEWATCVEILRTENLNPFELQWVVDKVERLNGKIRLTIQSLNDYNASFDFRSNTVYKYLKGDRVEFIENGDGEVFDTATYGLLNFATLSPFNDSTNTEADYFNQLLIDDNDALDSLVKGAKIEIQREKACLTEPTYFSICVSLPVVDGEIVDQTGSFTTFDTYLVIRTIGDIYNQVFEHHSPSDFFGERLSDVGKAYFVNKYENEKRYGRGLILNYADQFNRFDSNLVKLFDAPEQGDITAMGITDSKIISAIGEFDTFLAQVSDTLVRTGSDGIIRAAAPDQIISDAEAKLIGQYGCQYDSIGSLLFGDGFIRFVDMNKTADVIHNYNYAKDISMTMSEQGLVGRMKSYFKRRTTQIRTANANAGTNYLNHFRFSTGQNTHNGVLYLTIKMLSQGGINNAKAVYENTNETLMYHNQSDAYLGFASFTPESYSILNSSEVLGCAFLSFLNGRVWVTPVVPSEFNSFFNVSCDWRIGIAINRYPEKIKRALAMEVQDADALWYVSEVTTQVNNWISEVPVIRAYRNEDKVNFALLSNINSRSGLFGDDHSRGYFISILLTRDNSINLAYNSVNSAKMSAYSELGLILSKFSFSEQSGYSNVNQ